MLTILPTRLLATAATAALAIGLVVVTPVPAAHAEPQTAPPAEPAVASVDFSRSAELPKLDHWKVLVPEGVGRDEFGYRTAEPVGITERGELFGVSHYVPENRNLGRATRWNADGTIADLWDVGTEAVALNEVGTMAGVVVTGATQRAVVWKNGHQITLPDAGQGAMVFDINNHDRVAGAVQRDSVYIPGVWTLTGEDARWEEIPMPAEAGSGVARRINDSNVVLVGTNPVLGPEGLVVAGAWLWAVGTDAADPTPGAYRAIDLNESGYAVIETRSGLGNSTSAIYRPEDGVPVIVGGVDGTRLSSVTAMNDHNDLVGFMYECRICGVSRPVIWPEAFGSSPSPHRLDDLLAEVPGYGEPWQHSLGHIYDVNNSRSIVAAIGPSYEPLSLDYIVMIPDERPAALEDARLQSIDYPSGEWDDMPSRGVVQGTASRLAYTVSNPDSQGQHIVSVELRNADTGQQMPDGYWFEALDPFEHADGSIEFDTGGLAFDEAGNARPPLNLEIVVKGDGTEVERIPVAVPISPDPVVLVHGFNSSAATWSDYDQFLRSVHPGWLSFAVGDGQAPGVMNTGDIEKPLSPAYTIAENAAILAQYIEWVRDRTNAPHIDIVAHSMGGLISREYINDWMPIAADGKPLARRLIMLGTPNAGSPCADILDLPAIHELRTDVLADFNQRITNRKGVQMSILVGIIAPVTCQSPEAGDTVVPISSTMAEAWDGSAPLRILHTSMTGQSVFDFFVRPGLLGRQPLAGAPAGMRMMEYAPSTARAADPATPLPPLALSRVLSVTADDQVEIPFDADGSSRLGVSAIAAEGVVVELVDPEGVVVASGPGGEPLLSLSSDDGPEAGTWRLRVRNETPDPVSVGAAVYLNDAATTLSGTVQVDEYGVPRVDAAFLRGAAPVAGATVSAQFQPRSGFPRDVVLREQPDGHYRGASQALPEGPYRITLTATGGGIERITFIDVDIPPTRSDTTKPTVRLEHRAPDGAGWYRDRVDGVIRASDDASGVSTVSYELSGAAEGFAETTESDLPFSITAEGESELWWFARDYAGNFRRPNAGVPFLVDATAPTIEITGVDGAVVAPGEALIARYTCADAHSGIATCAGGTADGAALPTGVRGAHALTVRATDAVGHETVRTATYTVTGDAPDDTTPPTVVASQPPTGPHGWHAGPVALTLAATDAGSGVASVSWQVEGGIAETRAGDRAEIPVDAPGATRVEYWATDAAGNVTPRAVSVVRIDADAPILEVISPTEGRALAIGESVALDYTATDEESGVQATGATVSSVSGAGLAPVSLERGDPLPSAVAGEYVVTVTAVDAVGHVSRTDRRYAVVPATPDTTPPVILATVPAPGGWSAGPATVRLSATDDASGVAAVHWRLRGASTAEGSVAGGSAEIVVSADGVTELEYWAVDAAGNASAPARADVRVDGTAPVVHVDAPVDGGTFRAGAVGTASFSCSDAFSGVVSCAGSTPAGQPLPDSPGGHALVIEAVDGAGNRTSVTVRYTVIAESSSGPGPEAPSDPGTTLPATGGAPQTLGVVGGIVLVLVGLALVRRRRRSC